MSSNLSAINSFLFGEYPKEKRPKKITLVSNAIIFDSIENNFTLILPFELLLKPYFNTRLIYIVNKAPKEWGELIGNPAITTAILDRIVHRAEIIHLNGDNY